MNKKGLVRRSLGAGGFTLIEVVLAVVVITVSVSATLVILSKMMGYTINRGQAVDISNAITISQMAIDRVRDQRFPPTAGYGDIIPDVNPPIQSTDSYTLSNTTYTYNTDIVASDSAITTAMYDSTNGDSMPGYRNLLKVTVTVFKNGRQILRTVTYKTRNGYY